MEAFLAAGAPPVYVGFGSMPANRETGRTVIDAAQAVGRRVALSQGWAELGLIDDAPIATRRRGHDHDRGARRSSAAEALLAEIGRTL